jgi:HEAT repeat protein
MAYYDLSKEERALVFSQMTEVVFTETNAGQWKQSYAYFADPDTYIRKNAYLATGRLVQAGTISQSHVIQILEELFKDENQLVRQTVINAAGEIGCFDFEAVMPFFEKGLFDPHHQVRNAVIGSIKKMGQKNPVPVLAYAERFLEHEQFEIRREIVHGIELRGRTHPQDILPLLRRLEHDQKPRVRNTLVHVLGQIAYKKGCLETVCTDLKMNWQNKELVNDALEEIIDVHYRYRNFTCYTQDEARAYIEQYFSN